MQSTLTHPEVCTAKDFLPIRDFDFIEFYVGNAKQSAYFYRAAFGMALIAYGGPETGLPGRASYVLQQGEVRFVLTTPLRPDGGIADHVRRHGDGARDIALSVDDAKYAWRETTRRGARSVHECHELADDYGRVRLASVATFGDTIHTFIDRSQYNGPFLPGYRTVEEDPIAQPIGIARIDHIAANVGWNELHRWADYYADTLGFHTGDRSFRLSGIPLRSDPASKGVTTAGDRVALSISEPIEGRDRSPVERFLEYNHGPGVEHIALATVDIHATVDAMRLNGVKFREAGHSEEANSSGPEIHQNLYDGTLSAYTRPVEDRPTLFFEIIQRT